MTDVTEEKVNNPQDIPSIQTKPSEELNVQDIIIEKTDIIEKATVQQNALNEEKSKIAESKFDFTSLWSPWWKWISYGNGAESSNKAFLEISGFLFPSTGLKLPPAFIQGDSTVRLLVYPSDYGCPSFDPVCLQTLTFMRFLGQRYVVEYYVEPLVSPSGDLPCLLNDYGYCVGGREPVVKAFEQKAGKLLDAKLNDEQVLKD